ncbi:MAG: YetF domain-containing protein [Armatimonadota bacterium]|nr:DUF421 domain-containing protein [bacterium]
MWHASFPYWQFVVRAAVVYIAIIVLLRLGGKRQVGQMGVAEFVAILLISNAVQNSMNGNDGSITGGLILATVIIILSILVEYATFKSKRWEYIVQGRPTLLVHHGKIIRHNLDRERLNVRELKTILRRQGIHDLDEVAEAILESDGYVSVTKKSEAEHANGD